MNNELTSELNLLDPSRIRLSLDDFEDLVLELDGESHSPITAHRPFPLQDPNRLIQLKDADGEEIGLIPSLKDLDRESRKTLENALDQAYFMPQILRIDRIESNFHIPTWHVETDRGPRSFEIPSSRRDIRVLGEGRVLIRDADGNRYEIPDYRHLDPASRAFAETLI